MEITRKEIVNLIIGLAEGTLTKKDNALYTFLTEKDFDPKKMYKEVKEEPKEKIEVFKEEPKEKIEVKEEPKEKKKVKEEPKLSEEKDDFIDDLFDDEDTNEVNNTEMDISSLIEEDDMLKDDDDNIPIVKEELNIGKNAINSVYDDLLED